MIYNYFSTKYYLILLLTNCIKQKKTRIRKNMIYIYVERRGVKENFIKTDENFS
jgi:hypothetical protein